MDSPWLDGRGTCKVQFNAGNGDHRKNANVNQLNISSWLMYSAVQINVVKGCVSEVLAHAIFDHVYLDCRICSFRKWSVQS